MKKLSTAARLTVWYLVIFALGEVIFGGAVWLTVRHDLYDLVDAQVEREAGDLKNLLEAQSKDASGADLQEKIAEAYAIDRSRDYVEISSESGELIYRSAGLEGHGPELMAPNEVKRPLSRTRRIYNRPFRFLFEKLKANGRVFTVEIGFPADDAVNTLHRVRLYSLILGPVLLLVTALAAHWISRRAQQTEMP